MNLWAPIRREIAILSGCVDSSKESIRYVLTQMGTGRGCVVVIGEYKKIKRTQQ